MKNHRKYIILTIIWMLYIFYMSHQNGTTSTGQSSSISQEILSILSLPEAMSNTIETIVRKAAHVAEYAILTFLVYKSIFTIFKNKYFIAGSISILYACTDEIHQYFIPGRSAMITDVGIDSIGILLMLLGLYIFYKHKGAKNMS